MKVGTIVQLKVPCLGNASGTKGVVFNDYVDGVQVIFANGEYDGFNIEEQALFLMEIGVCEKRTGYVFTSVMQVSHDFRMGKWDDVFSV